MNGREAVERVFRAEHGRVVSTLMRSFGGLDVAEDAVQDAFARAVAEWPVSGPPPSPVGWIVTTARRAAIDRLRRQTVGAGKERIAAGETAPSADADDDRLRLLFTCAHPALAPDARIALTLRLICGLPTARIARLLLVGEATLAQRLVRAKGKVQAAGIPYRVPTPEELPHRLDAVLAVVYLLFTAGYAPDKGDELIGVEVVEESIRLGRLLALLMPREGEVHALLSLMLLIDTRRPARVAEAGPVPLAEQDRTAYDRARVAEGLSELARAVQHSPRAGAYLLEAAIQAEHDVAPDAATTRWERILALYDDLLAIRRSPVVALHRAVALAEVAGPTAALEVVDALPSPVPRRDVVRAELLRRLGRDEEAAEATRAALASPLSGAERRFLAERLLHAL